MFKVKPEITRSYILNKVSEKQIFEHFLSLPIIEIGVIFNNPLRDDKNPTCTFSYGRTGTLFFNDWSGWFNGDCFALVQKIKGVTFREACKVINAEMLSEKRNSHIASYPPIIVNKKKTILQQEIRSWYKEDLVYWEQNGISQQTLKIFNTYPLQSFWINGLCYYTYKKIDPAYVYMFTKEEKKAYFPFRQKNERRFITNSIKIQGFAQLLTTKNYCIITKSIKDVMLLYEFEIPSIAPPSETSIINEDLFLYLKNRYEKIFCLYDFDLTGVRSSNKMKKLYNIQPLFLTNGRFNSYNYKAKDITDLTKLTNLKYINELIKYTSYELGL